MLETVNARDTLENTTEAEGRLRDASNSMGRTQNFKSTSNQSAGKLTALIPYLLPVT